MERLDVFMRDSDAFSWYMEQDPTLRSTVVALAWLDKAPAWDRLVDKVDRASRLIPLFRQRLAEPPARLATPRWTFDESFDLAWHLRRIDAPAPHTRETVINFARTAAMAAFDHARPLWEFTLIEHVDGDGAALVMKIHHSLTDGVGGMQLALLLFDVTVDPVNDDPLPPAPEGERMGTSDLVRDSLSRDLRRAVLFAREALSSIPEVGRAALHPLTSLSESIETVKSVARTVAPVSDTLSPIMTDRGLSRGLGMLTVELEDLKRACHAAGGTLNDGFMAGVTGGLRRYHEAHGAEVGDLRVTLPISIRKEDDPLGGNRITLQRFAVPVGERNPAARIQALDRLCKGASHERSLPLTNFIAGSLNLLPSGVIGGMLKHVDFVASDVPGFAFPVYLAGAEMTGYFAFGPTIGTAVNITLLSYNGTCHVGVTVDTAAVPDPDQLMASLREGFDEVLDLGGKHAPAVLPLTGEAESAVNPKIASRKVKQPVG